MGNAFFLDLFLINMFFSIIPGREMLLYPQLNVMNIVKTVHFARRTHGLYTFLWLCFWHWKKTLSPSPNNMNACCLSSKPRPFLQGIFPFVTGFSLLLCLSLSPALSISLIYVLTCGHFLIIPILISATVNEWRDSSYRVWAFGLMWVL